MHPTLYGTYQIAAEIAANEMGVVDKKFVRLKHIIFPQQYCAKVPDEYIESTMEFIPVLKELGYMNHDLKVGDIFNLKFIEETHKEDAHY